MSLSAGSDVWQAALVATVSVEVFMHPIGTLITRIQSPAYFKHYKTANGVLRPTLFQGLYQGFGPTLIMGVPSSIAFFTVYEGLKTAFQPSEPAGNLGSLPQPVIHAACSAVADLVYCALQNPAEVIKQNAQVWRQDERSPGQRHRSPTLQMMKQFARHPTSLWAGYTGLIASHLPSTCLMFSMYEFLRELLIKRSEERGSPTNSISEQIKASAVSAGLAGGLSAGFFVPIDVITTRMRLAAGSQLSEIRTRRLGIKDSYQSVGHEHKVLSPKPHQRNKPLNVAKGILRKEGIPGLFRGTTLTCVAATLGSAFYLGCYEGTKLYLGRGDASQPEEMERLI